MDSRDTIFFTCGRNAWFPSWEDELQQEFLWKSLKTKKDELAFIFCFLSTWSRYYPPNVGSLDLTVGSR